MNAEKTGKIIYEARIKKGMTQKELADAIAVTDKAVCKWEKGHGCPDITLLSQLSRVLEIDIQSILRGVQVKDNAAAGNLKRLKVYRCPSCGNLVVSEKEIELSCCGNRMLALKARRTDDPKYLPAISEFDGRYLVNFNHPMTKDDYIANFITVQYDRFTVTNLFAEMEASVTLSQIGGLQMFVVTSKGELLLL